MRGAIRLIGLLNAAVWLGSAAFLTFVVAPAFFSAEVGSFLPRPHAGRAAEVMVGRYFVLHQWCAVVAILHLAAEYVHAGRPIEKWCAGLLSTLLLGGLVGTYWLQPTMHELQKIRYWPKSTQVQRDEAAHSFGRLHAASQIVNCLSMVGLLVYFGHLSRAPVSARYTTMDRARS